MWANFWVVHLSNTTTKKKKKIGVVGAAVDFDSLGGQSGTCTNYGIPAPFESLCHLSKELVDTLPTQRDY